MVVMSTEHLNLARKWRSRDFDQVIGQDLSVRILKNSLYLQYFFPVYLFSGQHGCGKTTTARIFAAAVNCARLELFQKDPKNNIVPCLRCSSCLAMADGNHPDFIEIDAASHTGVDNVRHIIDIAAFLPLIGRKKIYLIDEAHMLSKAAFNAFLKILEEPPASALFILATTELHKIIETVRSRSFQLLFCSVSYDILLAHLENICQQEKISYEREGLFKVVKQAKGSVRDALNLLEQVRFASSSVTKSSALRVFGHTDDETVVMLLEHVVHGDAAKLLHFLSENSLEKFCVETLWNALIELINACIWVYYKMVPKNFFDHSDLLLELVSRASVVYFNTCLELLYGHELLFHKTGYSWYLFEMLLMRMCHASKNPTPAAVKKSPEERQIKKNNYSSHGASGQVTSVHEIKVEHKTKELLTKVPFDDSMQGLWKKFIEQLGFMDPMLSSLFKQAHYEGTNDTLQEITIVFGNEFNFFNEIIQKSESLWKPLLNKIVEKEIKLNVNFKSVEKSIFAEPKKNLLVQTLEPIITTKKNIETMKNKDNHKNIDTSNGDQWQKALLLKTVFAGTIREIVEGSHE